MRTDWSKESLPSGEGKLVYRELVLSAVDGALDSVGGLGKDVVYVITERNGVKREDIPDQIQRFIGVLQQYFGSTANTVERLVLEEIELRTGVNGSSLVEVVKELKSGAVVQAKPRPADGRPKTLEDDSEQMGSVEYGRQPSSAKKAAPQEGKYYYSGKFSPRVSDQRAEDSGIVSSFIDEILRNTSVGREFAKSSKSIQNAMKEE